MTTALGQALIELADATESYKGPMLPPDLDISSFANKQLREDATLGSPATIEKPVYDTLAHLELLFNAGCDHLRSLGTLLIGERPSWFGHVAVARAVVETSCRLWLIADPAIDARERVHLHLLEWQYELNNQRSHIKKGFQGLPAPLMTALQDWVDDNQKRIAAWAASHGFELSKSGLVLATPRLGPTEALVALLDADPAAQGHGGVLGAYNYNRESAVAHGLPSGVAVYHRAAVAGGHAHNVLTGEHVGHAVLPAVTSFDAAFDRLAVVFRWQHSDLLPLRYQVIHEVNNLIQSAPART